MSKGAIVLSAVPTLVGGTLGQVIEHDQDKNIIVYWGSNTTALGAISNYALSNHTHGIPTVIGPATISSSSNGWTLSILDYLTTGALSTHIHGSINTVPIAGALITNSSASSGLTLGIPAYLTTAAQSSHTHPYAGTGTTINGAGSDLFDVTLNSNGIVFDIGAVAGAADGYNIIAAGTQTANSTGSVIFSNSNGISFGMSGNTRITASYSQSTHEHSTLGYAASAHTHGSLELSMVDISGTYSSASNGLTISLTNSSHAHPYAGTLTSATNVGLSVNSDGISVSLDTAGLTSFGDGVNILAAGSVTAGTVQTILFNDGNGITFGMDSDSTAITASHNAYSATSMFSASFLNTGEPHIRQIVVSDSSYSSGTVAIVGSNNITASYNGSSIRIIGANTHAEQTGISAIAVSNTTYTAGTVSFVNSNGISFGSSAAGQITASFSQSVQPIWYSASGLEFSSSTLEFANTLGVSFGLTNGSVYAEIDSNYLTAQSVQPVAISDSATSFAFSTLSLGTENGLTLYHSASSIVGSYTVPTQSAEPRIISINGTSGSLSISASRNVSINSSEGTAFTFYGPANILNSFSIGGNTGTTGSSAISGGGFILAGGDNITLSQSNNTISIIGTGGVQIGNSASLFATGSVVIRGEANVTVNTAAAAGIQYIDLSAGVGTAAGDGWNRIVAGGSTANSTGYVNFIDANRISFTLNSDSLSGSIGEYIATGFTTTATAGTAFVGTANSDGLKVGVPAYLTTALQTAIMGIIVSDATFTDASVSFKNANGVSFGSDGGNVLTASVQQQMLFSVVGTQTTASMLQFANTNGVSFSITNNTVGGTVRTDYASSSHTHGSVSLALSSGLTGTYSSASNGLTISLTDTKVMGGTNFSTTSVNTSVSRITGTLNTSGLTLGVPAFITTAMQSQSSSVFARTGFTTSATVGNNITGSLNTNGLQINIPAYLTTAMPYQSSTAFVGLNTAQTNVTWTVNSSGISLNAANYARTGATTATTSGNDIKATLNTGGLSIGFPVLSTIAGTGGGMVGTSFYSTSKTGTNILGALNSIGLSLSVPNLVVSSQIGNVYFIDSLGTNITWGSLTDASLNTSIYASAASGGGGGGIGSFLLSGNTTGNTTASGSTIQFFAGDNIIISGTNNSVIRFDVPDNAGSLYFTDGSGVTFGILTSGSNTTVSGSVATGSVYFDNAAGSNFTWGSSTAGNSTWIYGTAGGGTAGGNFGAGVTNSGNSAGLTGSVTNRVVFVGSDNITLSQSSDTSGATISLYGASGGAVNEFSAGVSNLGNSDGATGVTGTRLVFVGSNNITLSQTTGAAGATISFFGNSAGAATNALGLNTYIQGGLMSGNTSGLSVSIPVGSIYFSDGSGITFGSSTAGSTTTITASFHEFNTLNYADSNGIVWGVATATNDNSTVTASYNQAYYLSGTNASGTTSFSAGSAVTLSGGANITLSGNSNNQIVIVGGGGTGGGAFTWNGTSDVVTFNAGSGFTSTVSASSLTLGLVSNISSGMEWIKQGSSY